MNQIMHRSQSNQMTVLYFGWLSCLGIGDYGYVRYSLRDLVDLRIMRPHLKEPRYVQRYSDLVAYHRVTARF